MDLKLADFVLAIVSFIAGVIVPFVYRRFFFGDLSLKQPFDFRAVFQDKEGRERHQFVFCTIVKLANSSTNSFIIDDIRADSANTKAAKHECVGVDLKTSSPKESLQFPLYKQEGANLTPQDLDHLPFLVKANTELLISLGLWFRYAALETGGTTFNPTDDFMTVARDPGIVVGFRINGKYREYTLRAKPFERWTELKPN